MVYEGRKELMDPRKARYARKTNARTLADAIKGADIFLGLSAPGVLKPEMVAAMGERPIIFALANPTPEIMPEEVKAVRPEARDRHRPLGLSRTRSTTSSASPSSSAARSMSAPHTINEAMKVACVKAIAQLARAESLRRRHLAPMAARACNSAPSI